MGIKTKLVQWDPDEIGDFETIWSGKLSIVD